MSRIAIIGGGISGLSAASALEEQRRSGVDVDYVLFESLRAWAGSFARSTSTDVLSRPVPIHSSPKSRGRPIFVALLDSAINSLAPTTPIARLTF